MPIFYENFLKKTIPTNAYFEEEIKTKNLTIEKLSSLPDSMSVDQIPSRVIYQQGNERYCIVKIGRFVYSFSFIESKKAKIDKGLSLTFGLIENTSTKVRELKDKTAMLNYRDSSTKVNVGAAIVSLWKIILAYFKKTFPNNKLIYRSDLENNEHAVVSNLNAFLDFKSANKKELTDKIDDIISKVEKAKTYADISLDSGDSDYYANNPKRPRNVNKNVTQEDKEDMKKALNYFKNLIEKSELEELNKKNIEAFLAKFERKQIARTYLYTTITQMAYGISKTKTKIENINADNLETTLDEIIKQIKDDATVDLKDAKGTKITIINDEEEIKKFKENIKSIVVDSKLTDKMKKEKLEELVDDFYADNIQTINYQTNNRYVVMK
jgi:hypothetical protein